MEDPSGRLDDLVSQCEQQVQHDEGATTKKNGVKGEEALASSRSILKYLKDDGCDLIGSLDSSSTVRTGRQRAQRESTEEECRRLMNESGERVELINETLQARWEECDGVTAPHQLVIEIKEIGEMSGSILTAQQELINRLRDEVNRSESGIQQEIERQTDDLGVMRKRMKEHTSSTRDAHHDQLRHIDNALNADYYNLLSDHSDQMNRVLGEWSSSEDKILKDLNELGEQWDEDLSNTDAHYYQQSRQTWRQLTTDIQLVERDLEQLKANFVLNNEILDYDCKVLKFREEERAGLIFRQKRRINRLSERYRRLKEQLDKAGEERRKDENRLIREVEHLRRDCGAMEKKFCTIKAANDAQLESLCQLAEDRIGELLKKLAMIDKRIFEEVLQKPWDGLVGGGLQASPSSQSSIDSPELEEVINHLEKELRFLLTSNSDTTALDRQEKLKKALDLPDDQEFRAILYGLASSSKRGCDSEVLKDLAQRIRMQRTQSVTDPATTRAYLADPISIRAHFGSFKETAVPRVRLDLWKMLSKALIQYERLLRDRLVLAADILKH